MLLWKKHILRKHGIFTDFPGEVSLDLIAESPVFLGKVAVRKNVRIGKHTLINSGILWDDVVIGRYCSIAYNVFIAPPDHPLHFLSTWYLFYKHTAYYQKELELTRGKTTKIGNDVWIGANAVIRKGITIEDGAVIGAGAVVIEDVPAYCVVGGVPAKTIKYRFTNDLISRLLRLKWWEMDESVLNKLPFDDVNQCIEILERAVRRNKT